MHARISADSTSTAFDPDGQRVQANEVYPAPSQGTLTSPRFIVQSCIEAPSAFDEFDMKDEQKLISYAVLVSRMIFESLLDVIYAGPLGQLVLTQLERSRPKELRQVALRLFRRLRDEAKNTDDSAILYFRVQEQTIVGLFECSGLDAALAISMEFTRQWGPRTLPWLEHGLHVVLSEVVIYCVTDDKRRLPLLEVFAGWMKGDDFMREVHRLSLIDTLVTQCKAVGIDCGKEEHVVRFIHRARPLPPQRIPTNVETTEVGAETTEFIDGRVATDINEPPLPEAMPADGIGASPALESATSPVKQDKPLDAGVGTTPAVEVSPSSVPAVGVSPSSVARRIFGKRPLDQVVSAQLAASMPFPEQLESSINSAKRSKTDSQ